MSKITDLVKYSVTDQALEQYRKEFLPLTINGLDDSEGYEKVKDARLFIRGERVNVEKKRVELKAESLEFGRAVDAEAKRITTAILEVEDHLTAEQKKIDDEKARIKFEKEQREKLPVRLEKLKELGVLTSDELTENFSKDLLALDDVQFEELFNRLHAAKLERQRIAQEKKDEEQRLAQEKIDADKKAIEDKRIADELEEKHKAELEQAKIEAEERGKREAKEEAERKEAQRIADEKAAKDEQARIEAERPDTEKLVVFASTLTAIPFPEVTGKKAQAKVAKVRKLIEEAVSELKAA
jgi:hypothetical protein